MNDRPAAGPAGGYASARTDPNHRTDTRRGGADDGLTGTIQRRRSPAIRERIYRLLDQLFSYEPIPRKSGAAVYIHPPLHRQRETRPSRPPQQDVRDGRAEGPVPRAPVHAGPVRGTRHGDVPSTLNPAFHARPHPLNRARAGQNLLDARLRGTDDPGLGFYQGFYPGFYPDPPDGRTRSETRGHREGVYFKDYVKQAE